MGAWAWSSGLAPRFGLPVTPSPGLTSGRQGFDHPLPRPPPPLAWASVRVSQQVSLRLPYCVFFPDSQPECCLYRGGQIQTLAAATHRTHSGARAAGGPHTGQRPAPQPPALAPSAPAPSLPTAPNPCSPRVFATPPSCPPSSWEAVHAPRAPHWPPVSPGPVLGAQRELSEMNEDEVRNL